MKNDEKIAFMPIPAVTLAMAGEKDRRYHTASKMAQGIVSYTAALSDLAAFFHAVKTGAARPNSTPVSAWARAWGWDWRKALRFITIVLADFFELDEKMQKMKELRSRIEKAVEKQKIKMKNYVRKMRGQVQNDEKNDDESEDERLFLNAMSAIAKTNPDYYRAKIKENIRNNDEKTVLNFQKWLEKNRKNEIVISDEDVARAAATRTLNGHRIVNFKKTYDSKFRVEWDDGFETTMTAQAIVGLA